MTSPNNRIAQGGSLTYSYYDTFGLIAVLGCFDADNRTWLNIHHPLTIM